MSALGKPVRVGLRQVVIRGSSAIAVRLARLFPCIEVVAFDDDWSAIDRARDAASEAGVSERVRIHHSSAASPGPSERPAPRRAA